MPALHIRNRNDLIKYVTDHAPYRAVERALLEGQVENYGGFVHILFRKGLLGWVVKVTSKTGKIWLLAIPVANRPIGVINKVFWQYWIGDISSNNNLYTGDNPETYRKERENAKRETEEQRSD